jgi:hypothetical protein
MKESDEIVCLLRDIREYMFVLAEPHLLERERRLVEATKQALGKAEKRKAAAQLMDGSKTRTEIAKATLIDVGDLSRFMKTLLEIGSVTEESSRPKLVFSPDLLTGPVK